MSQARHQAIFLAADNQWYLEIGNYEYHYDEEREDFSRFGPFSDEEGAEAYTDNFSNTGGGHYNRDGKRPAPLDAITASTHQRGYRRYF